MSEGFGIEGCAGYLPHPPGFERLYNNFKKRYDPMLNFQHILQKPKYKKPTFEGRFFVVTCSKPLPTIPIGIKPAVRKFLIS